MRLRVLQFPAALPKIDSQFDLKLLQVPNFAANFDELVSQEVSNLLAGIAAVFPQIKKLFDLLQREAKTLHLPDKVEASNVVGAVKPKSSCCARYRGQQRAALVEPDSVDTQCRPQRRLADLDCALDAVWTVPHPDQDTLWTILQSQEEKCSAPEMEAHRVNQPPLTL